MSRTFAELVNRRRQMFAESGSPHEWDALFHGLVPPSEQLLAFVGAEESKLFRAKHYLLGITEQSLIVVPTNGSGTKRTGDPIVLAAGEITVTEADHNTFNFTARGAEYSLVSSEGEAGHYEFDFEAEGVDDST
ncbi:MAG TPA: hypothetical protein PLV68_20150, partial [Ilumatobacteraceae bacterium]|nr:hypothetical protein [Ilumatobacteraceae bacterium]